MTEKQINELIAKSQRHYEECRKFANRALNAILYKKKIPEAEYNKFGIAINDKGETIIKCGNQMIPAEEFILLTKEDLVSKNIVASSVQGLS